ncbi:hypothetical protein EXIGLDRAFT_727973 [Exidia glandulosa HHB12029]|uniref:Protein YOP1 n=1 Tax=Exidia glandulosa HHB12029 TaxID=1314781 RepID=A0A165D4Q7_EXIGL|nr:hypothetical protein EXIGLDRAFT_727973 [Exidia glandulosa HHB12029]
MYWSVIGVVVALEYVAEWLVSWIPLYYLVKTLFLLYLALPRAQGAQFVYTTQLRPFLAQYESQIDAAFGQLKTAAYEWISERLRRVTNLVVNTPAPDVHQPQSAAPPSQHDPMSGPATMVQGLWAAYGPAVVAGATAFVRAHAPSAVQEQAAGVPSAQPQTRRQASASSSSLDTASVLRRRRELEAELASLPAAESEGEGDTTRFEEVDDVSGNEEEQQRPGAGRRSSSWWGWGGGGARGDGYEPVRTD